LDHERSEWRRKRSRRECIPTGGYFAINDMTIDRMTIKPIATAAICCARRLRISRLERVEFFAIWLFSFIPSYNNADQKIIILSFTPNSTELSQP
jgi:hypothetical protein